jgi:hypothetical protein
LFSSDFLSFFLSSSSSSFFSFFFFSSSFSFFFREKFFAFLSGDLSSSMLQWTDATIHTGLTDIKDPEETKKSRNCALLSTSCTERSTWLNSYLQ